MEQAGVPGADSPVGVVPAPQPAAPWLVVHVEPLTELRLQVAFADGTAGEVDLQHRFLTSTSVQGTIFEMLRSPEEFRRGAVVRRLAVFDNSG